MLAWLLIIPCATRGRSAAQIAGREGGAERNAGCGERVQPGAAHRTHTRLAHACPPVAAATAGGNRERGPRPALPSRNLPTDRCYCWMIAPPGQPMRICADVYFPLVTSAHHDP